MNEWYSKEAAHKLHKRARLYGLIAAAALTASLAVCVFLCTRVRTGNASRLLPLIIGSSTLGGWAALLVNVFGRKPAKAQAAHMAGLLDAAREEYTGKLTVSREVFSIPGSISVRKAQLETENETLSFTVNARFGAKLPAPGSRVRVFARRTFIVGAEVLE